VPAFSDLESGYSDGSRVDDASLPNSHGSDILLQISLAKMGDKLTPEWEEKIRVKTAGLWESLSKIWTVTASTVRGSRQLWKKVSSVRR
jgi:hypothetical protein